MKATDALQKISDFINEKRTAVYNEIAFANEHNFRLEATALQYKASAYSEINSEILMLIHNLSK